MARALVGHLPNIADLQLVQENARLKSRIRELEAEITELRAVLASKDLIDELHRITASETALA
jgi:hypothetical protein